MQRRSRPPFLARSAFGAGAAALFVPRAGANPTNMTRILQGESCGTCHGTVAFTAMFTCERCHSVAQPGQKPWW